MIVLDTNVILDYIHEVRSVVRWVDAHRKKHRFIISTITIVELFGHAGITPKEQFLLELWLRAVMTATVDVSTAQLAAQIRRETKLTTTDSIIAATAMMFHADLATRDKDIKRVKGLRVINP